MSQATAVDDHDDQDDPEQEEFEVFLARQGPWIELRAHSLAAKTGLDHHALYAHTEDVLQRSWERLRPPRAATGRAFARTVMANRLRDLRKSGQARHEQPRDDVFALLEGRATDGGAGGPEDEVIRREERTRILRAIRSLPDLERDVIALRAEEHTFPAIAGLLAEPLEEVRKAVLRARRTLRALLGEEDHRER